MASLIESKVPDIGDYKDVPVIELLVKVGDRVARDQGLVTLESDKATLEVPSSAAGVVRELKVKLGELLSEGSVVAVLETDAAADLPSPPGRGVGVRVRGGNTTPIWPRTRTSKIDAQALRDPSSSSNPLPHPSPGGRGASKPGQWASFVRRRLES